MRQLTIILLAFLIACSNNKSVNEKELVSNASTQDNKQEATTASSADKDIVGEWELVGITEDKNGNDQLDEEERKIASLGHMKDYMKLNSNGSAVFHSFKTKGRYETHVNEHSKNRYLDLFDKENFKYPKGAIISVTESELIIMNKFGGDSFTIWKRL